MKSILWFVPVAAVLAGCGAGGGDEALSFAPSGDALIVTGVIDEGALEIFEAAITAYPDTKTLVLYSVPGSEDDDTNLVLAQRVRDLGLNTVVPSDGLVASGGTDLFLAGVRREVKEGACLGVHSWASGGVFDGVEGADLPRDDAEHDPYLRYFRSMGIPEEFYWYTLEVAPSDGMHWMSPAELALYKADNVDGLPAATGNETACDLR